MQGLASVCVQPKAPSRGHTWSWHAKCFMRYHPWPRGLECAQLPQASKGLYLWSLICCAYGSPLRVFVELRLYVSFQADHVKCTGKVLDWEAFPTH